jgi:hypothetical protein
MSYEVLEVVALPVMEERVVYTMSDGTEVTDMVATGESIRKEPGDTLTVKELQQHGQTSEDISALVEAKALKEKK